MSLEGFRSGYDYYAQASKNRTNEGVLEKIHHYLLGSTEKVGEKTNN